MATNLPDDLSPTTSAILRHIESLGFRVSVFRMPSSLLGRRPANVELHAVGTDAHQHIVTVEGEGMGTEYAAACRLAESVGIDLEDG